MKIITYHEVKEGKLSSDSKDLKKLSCFVFVCSVVSEEAIDLKEYNVVFKVVVGF